MIIQYEGELYLTEFKKINVSEEDVKAEEYKSLDREFAELAVAVNKYLTKGEQ